MSTPPSAERYPTVRHGYDPSLVESDLAAMERAHQSVIEDATAKIAALEQALALASSREGSNTADEADQIISSARKEAFRLITEAREEAGLVIAEARTEAEQTQGIDIAPESGGADRTAELRAEELRLEARIVELQATLAGLEAGIRSMTGVLASPDAHVDAASVPPPAHQEIALEGEGEAQQPVVNTGGAALVEPILPPRRKYSAPPPPPPPEPEPAAAVKVEELTVEVVNPMEQAPDSEGEARASWYSRRSAQLPHIGADAGRNALAAASELRATMGQKVAGKPEA